MHELVSEYALEVVQAYMGFIQSRAAEAVRDMLRYAYIYMLVTYMHVYALYIHAYTCIIYTYICMKLSFAVYTSMMHACACARAFV